MNPAVPETPIAAAYAEDEAAASPEYGAQFRRDLEALEACVIPGRHELPPIAGVDYVAFVDPSGGSQDSMTLAIAHAEGTDLYRDLLPLVNAARVELLDVPRLHAQLLGSSAARPAVGGTRSTMRRAPMTISRTQRPGHLSDPLVPASRRS